MNSSKTYLTQYSIPTNPISYENALAQSTAYFGGGGLEAEVFLNKYALRTDNNTLYEATPDDMHKRLAKQFHRIELKYPNPRSYEEIFNSLKDFKYLIPQGSPMSGIGNPFQLMSVSNCLQGDTKILTRDGFIPIKNLVNKEAEIMTTGGKWVMAPFYSYGKQKLIKLSLKKGKTAKKVLYATADHDWFVFYKGAKPKKVKTKDLEIGKKLLHQYGKSWRSFRISPFGAAHGIAYGDGNTVKNPNSSNSINLCGNSRSLGKYFINTPVSSDESLCEGGSDYYSGIPNHYRELPNIRENKSYLYGWLAGYFAADGHLDERGSAMINSAKRSDLEFVQDVCGVLGLGCSEISQQTVISNLTNKEHTVYKVFISKQHLTSAFFLLDEHKANYKKEGHHPSKWVIDSIEETDLIEEVFCAEVPETHAFVIEGNILSGNCFVVGNTSDSYSGIMQADEQLVQLMKRRGGVGTDISHLRPSSSSVNNAARSSTGAVSFMSRYSNTTREVAQQNRRGALMLSISGLHPDVEDFIDIKMDETKVTGANISIRQSDEFMKALEREDKEFTLRFPVDASPEKATYTKIVNPKNIWDKMIKNAWSRAEPGCLFWDTVIRESVSDCYEDLGFKTISTNPCFSGKSLIAVGDGRDTVTIKQLAEEGKDVLVYSVNPQTGKVETKWGRNPRITGYNKKLIRVHFDDDSYLDVTEKHKFPLKTGKKKEAKDLITGDSLFSFRLENNYDTHKDAREVKKLEKLEGVHTVYNITVEDNHTVGLITNSRPNKQGNVIMDGVFASNCGEIPLPIGDACRLLALNLYSFVKNPFTSSCSFDWTSFKEQVILGQRLMDDLVDLELEHVDAIIAKIQDDPEPPDIKRVELELWERVRKMGEKGRRTGFGITALGDMLAALNIQYGSEEANNFAEKVIRYKKHCEYESSVILAEERGTFPIWEHAKEKNNPFLLRLKQEAPELYDRMSKSGRRNIALSTIAPTGTVSMLAQTSSGIENVFSIVYFRSKKINPNDRIGRVDFVDATGDSWQEYPVFHPHFKTFLRVKGLSDDEIFNLTKEEVDEWFKKSPYYKATANDVDWVNKVEMQGRIQKHIDHSISVTVNLPKEATIETVDKVYKTAWKSGCKGITIYRDGSRTGVLNTSSKKESNDKIVHNNAPKRPKKLPCDIYHVTAVGEPWTVIVSLLGEDPYEVFALNGFIAKHKHKGELIRVKSGYYTLIDDDQKEYEDITSNNTGEEASWTRIISTGLRHGAKIEFIVEQLNKSEGSIVSFSKAIARTLKKYVKDEERAIEQNPLNCPNNGEGCEIIFSEGCLSCKTCGTSKCT